MASIESLLVYDGGDHDEPCPSFNNDNNTGTLNNDTLGAAAIEPSSITISSLDGKSHIYDSIQDLQGFSHPSASFLQSDCPSPSVDTLRIHPIELELLIMINDHNLLPIMYDRIMNWAFGGVKAGYQFQSPKHKALKKRINKAFPSSTFGGEILSHVFPPEELCSDYPITMWYFDPLPLIRGIFRDPVIMKHMALYPQAKYTSTGMRVYDEITSANWFHHAFRASPASDSNGNLIKGRLFVALALHI
jgi:hypothetical protein